MGSNRLRNTVYLSLAFAFGHFSADARLGETRDELRGPEGRYGALVGETSSVLKDSQEKVDVFVKDKIKVSVEYDKEGVVWRISYEKKDLGEKLIDNLLGKNGGERKWSKSMVFKDDKHWTSTDKQLHAVYYGNPVYKLVIMTRPALVAERRPLKLARKTEKLGDGEAAAEQEKKTDDPLEGF
jgi:hypothetical protein